MKKYQKTYTKLMIDESTMDIKYSLQDMAYERMGIEMVREQNQIRNQVEIQKNLTFYKGESYSLQQCRQGRNRQLH